MSNYKTRADLLIVAGKIIKMQEDAGIEPVCKVDGKIRAMSTVTFGSIGFTACQYKFPLTVVEGRAVFRDDLLWFVGSEFVAAREIVADGMFGQSLSANDGAFFNLDKLSWNPPKPKTVAVEMLREDAEACAAYLRSASFHPPSFRLYEACKKALETEK